MVSSKSELMENLNFPLSSAHEIDGKVARGGTTLQTLPGNEPCPSIDFRVANFTSPSSRTPICFRILCYVLVALCAAVPKAFPLTA